MFGFRARRRQRLRATPLSAASWELIDRNIPMIRDMSDEARAELAGHIQVLLHEKKFEGAGGLQMTDEIRLTIAAQAAVLLLHRDTRYYPSLRTILVYPRAYIANVKRPQPDGSIVEGPQARLGESWFRGSLVLSWADVLHSAAIDHDGHNVTLHEFAHQLDSESGHMNGAPDLHSPDRYRAWAAVLGSEYKELLQDLHRGHRSLLDPYAATNPAEFFAVATELFFERPAAMLHHHPELYEQLRGFYKQDPATPGPESHPEPSAGNELP